MKPLPGNYVFWLVMVAGLLLLGGCSSAPTIESSAAATPPMEHYIIGPGDSLEIFVRAGMAKLREKSLRLTGYLEWLVQTQLDDVLEVVTPSDPARRGSQLSIRVKGGRAQGRALFEYLMEHGIVGDWREPDVIRISPTPLYNRYADCVAFAQATRRWAQQGG